LDTIGHETDRSSDDNIWGGALFYLQPGQEYAAPPNARTCNQTVMSEKGSPTDTENTDEFDDD
jgi:hypothetical protein